MQTHIAFLRGINVGGNTVLPMERLKALCDGLGLQNVRTWIQSGNVIFESALTEKTLVRKLEAALRSSEKRDILVIIRSAGDLASVLQHNPFPGASHAQVGVMFFDGPVPKDFLNEMKTPGTEEVRPGKREVYIHFPDGMGRSKLRLPKMAEKGTVRNINTIRKIIALSLKRST